MTAAWAAVAVPSIIGALSWCTFVAKLLWNFRGKWDETNGQLANLRMEITRLADQDRAIEQRLERHLTWHDSHAGR